MGVKGLKGKINAFYRSPGLVNFGLLDELPNLSKYRGIKTPTVEIIGDLAHV